MVQEPRYGRFLSFINNIQKAEIEIQKIKIAKKPELIWPNHYSFGYMWPLNWQNQLKYPMHQPTFFILLTSVMYYMNIFVQLIFFEVMRENGHTVAVVK